MNADAVREAYEAVCAEAGPGVTVVAATKYVAAEDMGVLAEAGVAVVGENRAQDLQRKHALHGDAFRWHFIGAPAVQQGARRRTSSASSSMRSTPTRPPAG